MSPVSLLRVALCLLCLCSGYSRDTSFLEMVVDIIQELKRANPSLVYGKSSDEYTLFIFLWSKINILKVPHVSVYLG